MKSSSDYACVKSAKKAPRYNLRNRKHVSNGLEAKMADKDSEQNSCSDDENDCTIVQQDKVIEELREQIKALQKSLATSEKEKVQYIEALNQRPANNVISADVPSIEAIPASFKPTEVTSANFTTDLAPVDVTCLSNTYSTSSRNFTTVNATSANANPAGAYFASTNSAHTTYASATFAMLSLPALILPTLKPPLPVAPIFSLLYARQQ